MSILQMAIIYALYPFNRLQYGIKYKKGWWAKKKHDLSEVVT